MSARQARNIEVRRAWEASLSPLKNAVLYGRSVLTWERPIDFGLLLVLVSVGIWAIYSYEVTVLTLLSSLLVAWALLTYAMERFNVLIPWQNILPPKYTKDPQVDYFGHAVTLIANIRCDISDSWEDLKSLRAVNETRFVLQFTLAGVFLAYLGTLISGHTLVISILYVLLIFPGIIANSIPQKGFVIIEPYVKVYLDKALALKDQLVAKISERINTGKQPSTVQQTAKEPKEEASSPSSAPPVDDPDHVKHE
jgi:hypothetical protein